MSANASTSKQMPSGPIFEEGEQVVLHSINARPELNGTAGHIVEYEEPSQRYVVALASGERVRIKDKNLRSDDSKDADAPPAPPPPYAGPRDLTLYLVDGKLHQPAVPAAFSHPPATEMLELTHHTEHRLHLPAGRWEVRFFEQEESRVTVTLVAIQQHIGEHAAAWSELRGLSCTRTVTCAPGEDALSIRVEGGILVVGVPHRAPPTSAVDGRSVNDAKEANDPVDIKDSLDFATIRPHRQKATLSPDEPPPRYEPPPTDPDAMQRWTPEELHEASLGMPPVCIAAC